MYGATIKVAVIKLTQTADTGHFEKRSFYT